MSSYRRPREGLTGSHICVCPLRIACSPRSPRPPSRGPASVLAAAPDRGPGQAPAVDPALHRLRRHRETGMDPRLRGGDKSGQTPAQQVWQAYRIQASKRGVIPAAPVCDSWRLPPGFPSASPRPERSGEPGSIHGSRRCRSRWGAGSTAEVAARTEAGPRLGGATGCTHLEIGLFCRQGVFALWVL